MLMHGVTHTENENIRITKQNRLPLKCRQWTRQFTYRAACRVDGHGPCAYTENQVRCARLRTVFVADYAHAEPEPSERRRQNTSRNDGHRVERDVKESTKKVNCVNGLVRTNQKRIIICLRLFSCRILNEVSVRTQYRRWMCAANTATTKRTPLSWLCDSDGDVGDDDDGNHLACGTWNLFSYAAHY